MCGWKKNYIEIHKSSAGKKKEKVIYPINYFILFKIKLYLLTGRISKC